MLILIVTVQLALANSALSGLLSGPSGWTLQAERDAGTLVDAGKVEASAESKGSRFSSDNFLLGIRDQVRDAANASLQEADRGKRREELRRRIQEDIERSPRPANRELAIHPRAGADVATLQDATTLTGNRTVSSLSQPSITEALSIRAVTRLSLDRTASSNTGASGVSSLTGSGGSTTTDPISDADRLVRPIHGRPGIRPLPDDSGATGTLPIDQNTRPLDPRISDGTRPAPNTGSGGSTRAPDRRNTRSR
jgi:hypothetical protein